MQRNVLYHRDRLDTLRWYIKDETADLVGLDDFHSRATGPVFSSFQSLNVENGGLCVT